MFDMSRPTVSALVGRIAEQQTLLGVLDVAESTSAGTVLVSGDAGVGKTRLLAEVARGAEERGFALLVGHCIDLGDAGLAYLPFSEAFGRLFAARPDLGELILAEHPPLARLLPNHRLLTAPAPNPDDQVDRGAVFEAVLGALRTLARSQPVLLLIEDVHWADQSTRDLIGFLLTRVSDERLAVLASYRSDDLNRRHPLRRVAAEWTRLPRVQRVHLPPLDPDDMRTLIANLHPGPLRESSIAQILSRAEGNAFFAEELVVAADSCDSLPAELADLLLVRFDRLADHTREVVRLTAVAGRRVSHDLLAMVADIPDRELDDALREAIDAHVLQAFADNGYGFRHALLAEAVYDDLLPGERVRLHAAFARELQKASARGTAAELARHARESHDLPTAFTASLRAGDEAMTVGAPQEAMQHYEAAIELSAHAPADGQLLPERLIRLAVEAAGAAGHLTRALNLARQGLAADGATDPAERAQLLQALAVICLASEGDAEAFAATSEALSLVPAQPPTVLRVRVAAMHARAAMALGRDVEAQNWAEHSIEIANELGRPEAAGEANTTIALLRERSGDPDGAVVMLERTIEQATGAEEITNELRSRYRLGSLYYELGQLPRALEVFAAATERARSLGRQWAPYGLDSRLLASLTHYNRGEWDAALRLAHSDTDRAPQQAEVALDTVTLAVRAGRGDAAALDLLPASRPWWRRDGMIAVLCVGPAVDLLAYLGRCDEAQALLDEVVDLVSALWQNPRFLANIRLSAVGLAALSAGIGAQPSDRRADWVRRGRELHARGTDAAEHGLPSGRAMGIEGVAWQLRLDAEWARLRWLADIDPPEADAHVTLWRQSVAAFDFGFDYEQARSQARLAAVLRAIGDPVEAAAVADRARDLARRIGSEPLLNELRGLRSSGPQRRDATGGGLESLTARERDVLTLLVDGHSNRQLARQLYISEKTVSVHVSNILAKLGVRSRTEAAALARRDGRLD